MEFKMIHKSCLLVLLVLGSACERPMYFAGPEITMLNRLEKAGDVQVQGSIMEMAQQSRQGMAAVAVSNCLALRAGYLSGGDGELRITDEYGRLRAYQLGFGGFYPIGNSGYQGTTWLGYSRGEVYNVSLLYGYRPNRVSEYFELSNSYARFYLEQQLSTNIKGLEFFGMLRAGQTQVFNLSQQEVPGDPGRISRQFDLQRSQPNMFFASLGGGVAGGSKNLRLHLQIEYWMGPGRQQISDVIAISMSTGLSWRFGTSSWFR